MKNTKFKIISSTLCISIVFFIIGTTIKNNNINKDLKRFLLNQEETEEICSKASDKLKGKYKEMNYEKKDDIIYTENDKKFIDFLKDNSISNIAGYTKYLLLRYSLFIVADFILIVFWIFYCFCCCNPCCCCSGGKGCCRKLSYMICILTFILLIAIGIIGLIYGHPLKRNIYEASCSSFKLFEHFKYGFGEDYENSKEWAGLNNIYNILNDSKEIYKEMSEADEPTTIYNLQCNNKNDDSCTILKKGVDIINNAKNKYDDILDSIDYSQDSLMKFEEGLTDIENKYLNDAYSYLNDYVIKYTQLYILIFILVIAFGIIGFLLLSAYVHTCKCIKCFYVIFWNIEALFMIIIVLIGVVFGLLGAFSQNIIAVVQYSTTSENLNSSQPIIFNENILNFTNECFNEEGNFSVIIQEKTPSLQSFEQLLQLKESVDNNIKLLEAKDDNNLKNGFLSLQKIINSTDKVYGNYINDSVYNIINCKFMRNDINILIDEINENLKETSNRLELIIYAAGLCAGISILCGIIVINRYNDTNEKKKKRKDLNETQPIDNEKHSSSNRKVDIKEK